MNRNIEYGGMKKFEVQARRRLSRINRMQQLILSNEKSKAKPNPSTTK